MTVAPDGFAVVANYAGDTLTTVERVGEIKAAA